MPFGCDCYVTACQMPQVYLLLSCCPAEGRISGIVDAPNACATLAIPLAIFDQVRRGRRQGIARFGGPALRCMCWPSV